MWFFYIFILLSNYNFVLSMLYSNIRFNESPYRSAVLISKNSLPAIENESTITIQHKSLRMLKNANCIFLFNHLISFHKWVFSLSLYLIFYIEPNDPRGHSIIFLYKAITNLTIMTRWPIEVFSCLNYRKTFLLLVIPTKRQCGPREVQLL